MSEAQRHFDKTFTATTEWEIPIFGRMINALRPAAMEHFATKGGEFQANKNKAEPEESSLVAPRPAAMEHFAAKEKYKRQSTNITEVTWDCAETLDESKESRAEMDKAQPEKLLSAPRPSAMDHSPGVAPTAPGEIKSNKDIIITNEGYLMEAEEIVSISKAEASMQHSRTQALLDQPVHSRRGRNVPIAISYFTEEAEKDRRHRMAEARELHLKNMSDAHRHFNKMSMEETEQQIAKVDGLIHAPRSPRPAAMEPLAAKGEESQANKSKAEWEKSPRPTAREPVAAQEKENRGGLPTSQK